MSKLFIRRLPLISIALPIILIIELAGCVSSNNTYYMYRLTPNDNFEQPGATGCDWTAFKPLWEIVEGFRISMRTNEVGWDNLEPTSGRISIAVHNYDDSDFQARFDSPYLFLVSDEEEVRWMIHFRNMHRKGFVPEMDIPIPPHFEDFYIRFPDIFLRGERYALNPIELKKVTGKRRFAWTGCSF